MPHKNSKAVSRKIRKVKRDSPKLTQRQVVGKVFGILKAKHKKR